VVQVYLLPIHASSRISQFRGTYGLLLIRYTAVLTASVQNCLGNSACIHILLARSSIVLFMRFVIPFWWRFLGTVFTLRISRLTCNSLNLPWQYSL